MAAETPEPGDWDSQRAIHWLKGRVRDLEAQVAALEKVSHAPVDLRPLVAALVEAEVRRVIALSERR